MSLGGQRQAKYPCDLCHAAPPALSVPTVPTVPPATISMKNKVMDLTKRYKLSKTFKGNHIYAIKISDNVAKPEPEHNILLVAISSIHVYACIYLYMSVCIILSRTRRQARARAQHFAGHVIDGSFSFIHLFMCVSLCIASRTASPSPSASPITRVCCWLLLW